MKHTRPVQVTAFYCTIISLFLFGTIIGNKTVYVISEKLPVERKHHIVIDAGHGGEDGGAISNSGRNESNYNLQISLRLNDIFHLLGYDTILIRSTDTSVYTEGETIAQKKTSDLKYRVSTVKRTPNAVLISIHQNSFPEEKYSGAQVFYANNETSQTLAECLQQLFISTLNQGSIRKAKQGRGIYLLDHINTTGVLVECGFLTNNVEETKLRNSEYQKQLCCVICAATATFLSST